MRASLDGPAKEYDPVEDLVKEVEGFKYLGSWQDPDILMETSHSYGKTLACGRWDLARQHIMGEEEKKPSLNARIFQAEKQSDHQASQEKRRELDHPR